MVGKKPRKKVTFRFEKRNYFLNAVQRGSNIGEAICVSTQIDFEEASLLVARPMCKGRNISLKKKKKYLVPSITIFIKSVSPIHFTSALFRSRSVAQRGNCNRATNVVYAHTRETKGIVNFSLSRKYPLIGYKKILVFES